MQYCAKRCPHTIKLHPPCVYSWCNTCDKIYQAPPVWGSGNEASTGLPQCEGLRMRLVPGSPSVRVWEWVYTVIDIQILAHSNTVKYFHNWDSFREKSQVARWPTLADSLILVLSLGISSPLGPMTSLRRRYAMGAGLSQLATGPLKKKKQLLSIYLHNIVISTKQSVS